MLTNLYQAMIMDHYHSPRNKKNLQNPEKTTGSTNPSCGDSVSFELCIKDGIITEIAFQGAGCVLSQAAASMLTEKLYQKPLNQVYELNTNYMLELIGIELGPTRLRCVLLPLEALQKIK